MAIVIRSMTIDDYDEVYQLWESTEGLVLTDADSKPVVANYLDRNPDISQVALDGTRIVGAALCGHDGRRGLLHHLAVLADYRGKGIGRRIVDECMAGLKSVEIARCNIYVLADHEDGKQFWLNDGFWEWPNLCLMSKDLIE